MTTPLTVLLGNYPHTRPLKDGSVPVDGVDCQYLESSPLPPAFARMVRDLAYDICEMPTATYLQAREAGVPVTLLPAVLIGSTHHRSLTRLPEGPQIGPGDLVGRRVGVRAYGQTTGLWVRGWLQEEYGVRSCDVTWVTTEDVHVAQYVNPPYVERSRAERVADLLRSQDVDAAVLGPKAIGGRARDWSRSWRTPRRPGWRGPSGTGRSRPTTCWWCAMTCCAPARRPCAPSTGP